MPLVSICIPTYQRPELLRAAVASCLGQTFSDFEILITDNTRDNSAERVAAEFGDPRIHYHRNEANVGPFENLIRVTRLARGSYIKLLMDDDLLKPVCLEKMVAAMERNPEVGLVMSPMEIVDANGTRIFPKFYGFRRMLYRYRYQVGDGRVPRKKLLRDFLTKDYPCCVPSGVLFRRECLEQLGPMDIQADFAIDLDLAMRLATRWDFYYIDQILSSWRYLESCHTATLHAKGLPIQAFYYITEKILQTPEIAELFPTEPEQKSLRKQSYYFCSCRALLNVQAALKTKSPRLLLKTWSIIRQRDPYPINHFKIPFFALKEILASLFPKRTTPPRGGC